MFKRKLGHARKYNNALDMSLGKTNLINLEPILVLFICVNLHKSVIRNTKNSYKNVRSKHFIQFALRYVPNNPHFKEKLLGKNNLICYNIERVNIFCAAAGQQR